MRMVDADYFRQKSISDCPIGEDGITTKDFVAHHKILALYPTIDAVPVPCKIGGVVYGIRDYKGVPTVKKGVVGEMFFTNDMKLMIVVDHLCRGYWLEKVFPTYEAAEAAIRKENNHAED